MISRKVVVLESICMGIQWVFDACESDYPSRVDTLEILRVDALGERVVRSRDDLQKSAQQGFQWKIAAILVVVTTGDDKGGIEEGICCCCKGNTDSEKSSPMEIVWRMVRLSCSRSSCCCHVVFGVSRGVSNPNPAQAG